MSHKKFGPDRFSRFDVHWIQTDRQTNTITDRQAKFIYRLRTVFELPNVLGHSQLYTTEHRIILSVVHNGPPYNHLSCT